MYLKEYIIILLSCSNIVGDIQGEIRLCLHFWIVWYKSYAELEKSAFGHTITGINRIIPRGYFTTLVFFSKITFAKWIQYRKPSRAIFLTLDEWDSIFTDENNNFVQFPFTYSMCFTTVFSPFYLSKNRNIKNVLLCIDFINCMLFHVVLWDP